MSNSPVHGLAECEYPAGACPMDWSAVILRKRDELCSYLDVLEEARRRLDEIVDHDAGDQLVPAAGDTHAAADESSDTAGGGDDDFYPLGNDDEMEEERPMQWQDQVCRQMVYNISGHVADSHNHDDIDLDFDDDDEISRDIVARGLHVPHIQQQSGTASPPTPLTHDEEGAAADGGGDSGFGAVPASAAAIAGLGEHMYDGSGSDSMCVICMREYKKGRRLRVVPCAYKHRFHGRCIREWLSRSNLCPLCRHALPTAAKAERGEGGGRSGVHNSRSTIVRVRVNVNPY